MLMCEAPLGSPVTLLVTSASTPPITYGRSKNQLGMCVLEVLNLELGTYLIPAVIRADAQTVATLTVRIPLGVTYTLDQEQGQHVLIG